MHTSSNKNFHTTERGRARKMKAAVESNRDNDTLSGLLVAGASSPSTQAISRHAEKRLPADFKPGPNAVIFGRAKTCYGYRGNQRMKDIAGKHAKAYSAAKNKNEKIAIVNSIIAETRRVDEVSADDTVPRTGRGQFVIKKDDGAWYDVDSTKVRDKVGGLLRECLYTHYRSSSKSKRMVSKAKKLLLESQQAAGLSPPIFDPKPLPENSRFSRHGESSTRSSEGLFQLENRPSGGPPSRILSLVEGITKITDYPAGSRFHNSFVSPHHGFSHEHVTKIDVGVYHSEAVDFCSQNERPLSRSQTVSPSLDSMNSSSRPGDFMAVPGPHALVEILQPKSFPSTKAEEKQVLATFGTSSDKDFDDFPDDLSGIFD